MVTNQGTWTVLSGGKRGILTATDEGLSVTFGEENTAFAWADDVGLEFPTSYSTRIVQHGEVVMALGFGSTGEQQTFRRAMSPPGSTPPDDRTMVMSGAKRLSVATPFDVVLRAFWIGVAVQLLGGLFLAIGRESGVAVGFGLFLLWAGGIPVLAAIVAWGVRKGLEGSR